MIKELVLCIVLLLMQDVAKGADEKLEKFRFDMSFKGGYNPYRIFGDVPLPPKKTGFRSRLFGNCFCADVGSAESIYVRIKVASTLRYNLINVFGYILHRRQMELNTDYYTSLYFILTVVKLNHVDIISLVEILNGIAFDKPNQQYTKVFEAMEKRLPRYLTCAATFWKNGILNKTIDMDKILMPYSDNTVVQNILEGITPEELKTVSKPDPPQAPADDIEKKILFDFNQNILKLYQSLKKRVNVNLFPWLIAGIIQFFPRTLIQPDLEESIMVLTQYFYERNISEFKNVDLKKNQREPFDLVRYYLGLIIESKNAPDIIKDSANTIYNNLKSRSPTAVNPHYASFTYFVQPDNLKIDLMLQYISTGAFPLDIVLAADRIRFYIDQKFVGYFTLVTTFNPYLYSSPTEVVIALLDRIMRRQPELSSEILNSVGAVYSYLIFKYRYVLMPVTYPTDMQRMNVLTMGFKSPDVSITVENTMESLISLLPQLPLQYGDILINKVPIYKCSTPVTCFSSLLIELKKMGEVVDEKTLKLIVNVLQQVQWGIIEIRIEHSPEQLYPEAKRNKTIEQFHREFEIHQDELPTTTTQKATTILYSTTARTTVIVTKPTTTQPPPTTPTEGEIKTVSTAAPTTPTTPTPPPAIHTTDVIVPTEFVQPVPGNQSALLLIMKNITQEYTYLDEAEIRQMVKILDSGKFAALMAKAQNDHLSIITTYLAMLEAVGEEHTEAKFLAHLQQLQARFKRVEEILSEMTIEPKFGEPSLYGLTIAVPQPKDDAEKVKFDLLKEVLSKQELFKIIISGIEKKELTTVGALLKAVLREEVKLTDKLSKDELDAVAYYESKVQSYGFANSKITYTFSQEVITKEINVSGMMDGCLDFKSLDTENKKNFNAIIDYLGNSKALEQWNKWIHYPTAGKFTQAMFKYLLDTPSIPPKIREAVQKLTPMIDMKNDDLKNLA